MTIDSLSGNDPSSRSKTTSLGARIAASPLLSNLRTRYLAVVQTIEDDIAASRLRPGDRLPTQRELAAELGIATGTITRAYTEAKRRGLVSGEVGRGTFVAMPCTVPLMPASQSHIVDLRVIRIVPQPCVEAFASTLRSLAARTDLADMMGYQEAVGPHHHRVAGAAWIARAGFDVDEGRILVCSGAQHAMAIALGSLAVPGDIVLTERLNYPGIRLLEGLYHLRMQGVECDREGLSPDALEDLCEKTGARFLLCTPTAHNPTCATMSLERRKRIADIAVRKDLTVIENDPYALLEAAPLPPISAFAPERSYYISTASKTIGVGIRVGFLAAPPRMIGRVVPMLQATLWMTSPLLPELFSIWMHDGTMDRILEWNRKEAQERQQIAKSLLGDFCYSAHPFGYHVWLNLPEPWREMQFTDQLKQSGVLVSPADTFLIGRSPTHHAVRVSLGGVQSRNALKRGLRILAEGLRSRPPAQHAVA